MKAVVLIKNGDAASAFELREVPKPVPAEEQVLIKVEAFGLNFADVMARKGMYKDAPPIPAILGYDVAGIVEAIGDGVTTIRVGDWVTAMTRFGGYAEYAVTQQGGVAVIPNDMDAGAATALTTQYCTAYYAAAEMVNLFEGDKVLIHAGAGGVGTALIQFAKYKRCEIFATAGSDEKLKYLSSIGVHHPMNYTTHDFENEVKQLTSAKGVDVIFDAVGGASVKKGIRSLASGGRIVCYGAADMTGKNILGKVQSGIAFGFYHPAMFIQPSKSLIGINMLRIADHKINVLQRCLQAVVHLTGEGVFAPKLGKTFNVKDIAEAHSFLENRNSIGKIAIRWS